MFLVHLESTANHLAQQAHHRALGDNRLPPMHSEKPPIAGETSPRLFNARMANTPPPRLDIHAMVATALKTCCAGAVSIMPAIAWSSTAMHRQLQILHPLKDTGRNPWHAPFLQADARYSTSRNGWEKPCSTPNLTLALD